MLFVGGRIMHNIIVYSTCTPGNWSECAPGVAEIELQILHAHAVSISAIRHQHVQQEIYSPRVGLLPSHSSKL